VNWQKAIGISLIVGLAGGLYALYRYGKKESKKLQDYQVDLTGIKFTSFSEDLVTMDAMFRITNKSAIEATIEKLYADTYLNGAYVGNVVNSGAWPIPAKGTSDDIKLSFTFSSKQILKNIVGALFSLITTKDVPYRIAGSATVKSLFVSFSVPFDYSGFLKSDMLGTATPVPATK
jgi:LEA14-like dessication related protein